MDLAELDLQAAIPTLASRKQALMAVRRRFPNRWRQAARLMAAGRLDGDLGGDLDDFLTDTIRNYAGAVWGGLIDQGHDKYPVTVYEYCGIYWVHALEYDPVGYFRSREAAIGYVMSAWDAVGETPGRSRRAKESQDPSPSVSNFRPLSAQEEHDLANDELELQRGHLGV